MHYVAIFINCFIITGLSHLMSLVPEGKYMALLKKIYLKKIFPNLIIVEGA